MDKNLLIRHIAGNCAAQEEREVMEWLSASELNRKYYSDLKNMYVRSTLPESRASDNEVAGFWNRVGRAANAISAERLRKLYRRKLVVSYAVSAAAVLLLAFVLFRDGFTEKDLKDDYVRIALSELPSEYVHTVYTENGVKAKLFLPDSSVVWLNSGSEIRYPDRFAGETREVEFSGEAYFDVRSDSLRPMIVKTNRDFEVRVFGTEFNLKTYDDRRNAEATLYSGKITLVSGIESGNERITEVMPNEKIILSDEGISKVVDMKIRESVVTRAWKEGRLIFNATRLEDVVKELRRWHGTPVVVKDSRILDYRITADFNSESIVQIAEMIKYCALVDYEYRDGVLYLFAR